MKIKNVLVVRFRQLGDAVLTTVILNNIRENFPEARIDYVLNDNLASLFEGHPSIDRIITFTKEERDNTWMYLKKIWRIMHDTRYDVIIDKRSTLNTVPFALFSLHTPIRVALRKSYTWPFYNYRIGTVKGQNMIDHMLQHLEPLEQVRPLHYVRAITLKVSDQEISDFHACLLKQGITQDRPVVLMGVTAKLESKTWPLEKMTEVIRRFINRFPECQIIFNYAPSKEEDNARKIYQLLDCPANVFIDVQARSSRQLAAMSACISLYFGNEGGARHIVHAMRKPSLVVCSPVGNPQVWIPKDDVPAEAIDYTEASVDRVWEALESFTVQHIQ